jgi:hypothetical protein
MDDTSYVTAVSIEMIPSGFFTNAALSNFRFLHYRALHCIAAVCKLTCDLSSGHLPVHDVCRDTGRDLHHIFLVG